MPVVRFIAEGVGPFEKLDVDFSDGHGNPHPGPHILAGVNGSGKSTLLRAIAWVMDRGQHGFPNQEWQHFLRGHPQSRALVVLEAPGRPMCGYACTNDTAGGWFERLQDWVRPFLPSPGLADIGISVPRTAATYSWARFARGQDPAQQDLFSIAAYAPSRALSYVDEPDLRRSLVDPTKNCLAFDSTIQNEAIQAWLIGLFSKRALAKERKQSFDSYTQSLCRFQSALEQVCDQPVRFDVQIEPSLQPQFHISGQTLNFSQLADGVRVTVGWLADFMMRQDLTKWDESLGGKRPGLLLLDEVDIYLHPRWQRTLLPAMRKALPDVQIIASSHSPFVISSCPGSRVHVLQVDERGRAHARPPVDAPFGQSVTATLKDIFEVRSRFDIQTERDLDTWNDLKRKEASGALRPAEKKRLERLTRDLSERNEELRLLVNSPPKLSRRLVESLVVGETGASKRSRRPAQRIAG